MSVLDDVKVFQDFVQGDTFDINISHNPVLDISDAVFEVTMAKIQGGDPILSVSYTVPNTPGEGQAGIAIIPMPAAKTSLVGPGKYFASIKRTLSGGQAKTLLRSGMKTSAGANIKKVEVFENLDQTP